jgi:hypothetical protein
MDKELQTVLATLLAARNNAQVMHWQVKSLSQHLALGELYAAIDLVIDPLAEVFMGEYGEIGDMDADTSFSKEDPIEFISQLQVRLADAHDKIPQDGYIVNKYEELQELVSRVKYKLENLK